MVDAVSPQLLQSISTPSINPNDIFKSYLAGKEMKQQAEEYSIRKELHQMQKHQYEQEDIDRQIRRTSAEEENQFRREENARAEKRFQLESTAHRLEATGDNAIAVLELAKKAGDERTFMEQYRVFRERVPPEYRPDMPPMFRSIQEAMLWGNTTSAQAGKLLPYKQLQIQENDMQEWEFRAKLYAIPPEELTPAQQRQLLMYENRAADKGYTVPAPSKERTRDTATTLQGIPYGEGNVLGQLHRSSVAPFVTAISGRADSMVAIASSNGQDLPRDVAIQMITKQMIENGQLVPDTSFASGVRSFFGISKGQLVYKPTLQMQQSQDQTSSSEISGEGLVEKAGWLYKKDKNGKMVPVQKAHTKQGNK